MNCLLAVYSFSVLAKGETFLSSHLSSEGHSFPLLLGWRYTLIFHTPRLVTDGRSGDGRLALVPFISIAVVMTRTYLYVSSRVGFQAIKSKYIK